VIPIIKTNNRVTTQTVVHTQELGRRLRSVVICITCRKKLL